MKQDEYLRVLLLGNPKAVIVGSIGSICYDLTNIPHYYKIFVRGAMGAVLGCGLGYALARPERQVIVIIGEGSLLMQLGSISTILKHKLKNLRIIVINNGQYASCGGQKNNFEAIKDMVSPYFEIFTPELSPKNL